MRYAFEEELLGSLCLLCFFVLFRVCSICDLLWSDPDKDIEGWGENDRGVSFTFGGDVVAKFLKKHDLDLVCRAHQVVEDGYEFFAKRRLVTIFSAPNYVRSNSSAGMPCGWSRAAACSSAVSVLCSPLRLCVLFTCLFALCSAESLIMRVQ